MVSTLMALRHLLCEPVMGVPTTPAHSPGHGDAGVQHRPQVAQLERVGDVLILAGLGSHTSVCVQAGGWQGFGGQGLWAGGTG